MPSYHNNPEKKIKKEKKKKCCLKYFIVAFIVTLPLVFNNTNSNANVIINCIDSLLPSCERAEGKGAGVGTCLRLAGCLLSKTRLYLVLFGYHNIWSGTYYTTVLFKGKKNPIILRL